MDIVLGVIAVIIFCTVTYSTFQELCDYHLKQDAEDEAFERRREARRKEMERQEKAIARRVLIQQCENVHIGNWRND